MIWTQLWKIKASAGKFSLLRWIRTGAALLCGGLAWGAQGQECRFVSEGLQVAVTDTGSSAAELDTGVEIELSEGTLTRSRVAISSLTGMAGCWQADLDHDKSFEVVVALRAEQGPNRLLAFEWNGSLLEKFPLAGMTDSQQLLFGTAERIEMQSGQLMRSFLPGPGAAAEIPGQRLYFVYDLASNKWTRVQNLRRP